MIVSKARTVITVGVKYGIPPFQKFVGNLSRSFCVTPSKTMGSFLSCGSKDSYSVHGSNTNVSSQAIAETRKMSTQDDVIETVLCKEDDVPDGGLKEFEVEGAKILLVKNEGQLSAIGGKCTHYGAPLAKGALCNGRIRCPFHGACFNVKTGDIEDFPGLDSIPTFDVQIHEGEVKIKASRAVLSSFKRIKQMRKRDPSVQDTYVIIGGGASGAKCSETLRQEGFAGRIILISAENVLPYDRPKLSKFMNHDAEKLALRSSQFYQDADIDLKLGSSVVKFDASKKCLSLSSGESISFDKCLIATGGKPRRLAVPGCDLEGVHILRTPGDGNAIAEAATGRSVVVVGTSFIGMEVAAYLSTDNRSSSVTVIGSSSVPFERGFGKVVGERLFKWFQEKGVQFRNGASLKEIKGKDGKVSKVVIDNGEEIEADLVVAGIGVTPSTEFLQNSGIEMDQRGYVPVSKHMETNVGGIYTGGDIASFPLGFANDARVCIGHWQIAHNHGHVAALNMVGKSTAINTIPFFWTMLFGKSIRYAGYGGFDDVIIGGDLNELSFIAYYCKGEKVVAVASMGKDPAAAVFANYVQEGRILEKSQVLADKDIAFKLVC